MRKIDIFQQKPTRVTLADVAREAGVSKPTVCRALQGKGRISKATAKRIEETAERLGYKPDPTLSALSRYRWAEQTPENPTYSLAIVRVLPKEFETAPRPVPALPATSSEIGIRERARELNLIVEEHRLIASTRPDQLCRMLVARGVDGLIFDINGPVFDWTFQWEQFACVTIGFDHESHHSHAVTSDWFNALGIAVAKAVAAGYRRIGFANFIRRNPSIDNRILGAMLLEQRVLEQKFGPQPAIFDYPADHNPEKDVFKTEKSGFIAWLERERPEVVIDTNSFGVWWLKDAGYEPGKDIGYVTLMSLGEGDRISVSGTIHQKKLQGKLAVDLLLNLIQINQRGLSETPLRLTTSCLWFDGTTLGCPPKTKKPPASRKRKGA